jgi:hypothetical protein
MTVAEERLDELAGMPDGIGGIAGTVSLAGPVKGAARRAMTPALAIRMTLLMTLMDSDYAEVMAALIGDPREVIHRPVRPRPPLPPSADAASAQ